jgi:hypothetical protein
MRDRDAPELDVHVQKRKRVRGAVNAAMNAARTLLPEAFATSARKRR